MIDGPDFVLLELLRDCDGDPVLAAEAIFRNAPTMLDQPRHIEALQSASVLDVWKLPLDGYEATLVGANELREEFDASYLDEARSAEVRRVQVLRELLQDAVLVGSEVMLLLRHGYPAGALSRWRTLHELEVAAEAIFLGGDSVAFRFLEHEAMRQGRHIVQSHVLWKQHDQERLDSDFVRQFDQRAKEILDRYEPEFAGDLGWSHPLLVERDDRYRKRWEAGERPRGPNLADLRRFVGLAIFSGDYALASFVTHGSSRVRHLYAPRLQDATVTGPTDEGLHVAGICSAQALSRMSSALCSVYPDPPDSDLLEAHSVLSELSKKVVASFRLVADELNDAANRHQN